MSVLALLRREPRAIAFGLLHTIAATVGQTFLISLFLPGIKAAFGLGDAGVSVLFTATTLASAAALWRVGAWIDRADLLRYALSCAALLLFACAIIGASGALWVLALGLFCLRLAGNGLLTHVAVTATARYFSGDRGRALSIVLLGSSIGEGALPAVLVPLIGAWGWRATLVALGAFGVALVLVAARLVRRQAAFRTPLRASDAAARAALQTGVTSAADNRRYFLLTAPLFVTMWTFITATIFHQSLVAQAKGLSLQWFAVSYIAFAAVRVPVSVLTGRLIDRIGSARLFCLHVLPLALGTVVLVVAGSPWVAPFYWFCAGVTSGMGTVLQSTVVAERVPRERLGRARSLLGAMGIVASAAGPTLYGGGLAAGASMSAILWASVAFFVLATALGLVATRRYARGPHAGP
jgi:MFS family permease